MSDPDDITRMVLAIFIWIAFIGSLGIIIIRGIPKDSLAVVTEMMATVGSGAALIINYYFKRHHH